MLTEREREILRRFERRLSNPEIAAELGLTVGTVKWYAQQIFNKLGVSDRRQAVDRARSLGLLGAEKLDTQTLALLDALAQRCGVTQTGVLACLIHEKARDMGIEIYFRR